MELTDILAGFSHDSFCFSVCIHIPILAFLSLSLDTSSSMQAIIVSFLLLSSRSWFTRLKNFSSLVENRAEPVDVAMVSLTLMAIRRMSSSPLPFQYLSGTFIISMVTVVLYFYQIQPVVMYAQKIDGFSRLDKLLYLFMSQMLVIFQYSPVRLETEVDAAFLKVTHSRSYIVVPVHKKPHTLPV